MWVVPKNFQLSAFVPDTVESKEDLTLLESSIESSLMWRSKPSRLPTWLRRWKKESWIRHLFGRILKPSQHTSFEEALTSSLEVILVNRFLQQENDKVMMIPDTSGLTSDSTSELSSQEDSSLKTSKDISRLDSPAYSAT